MYGLWHQYAATRYAYAFMFASVRFHDCFALPHVLFGRIYSPYELVSRFPAKMRRAYSSIRSLRRWRPALAHDTLSRSRFFTLVVAYCFYVVYTIVASRVGAPSRPCPYAGLRFWLRRPSPIKPTLAAHVRPSVLALRRVPRQHTTTVGADRVSTRNWLDIAS